jgi:hypothetical protein
MFVADADGRDSTRSCVEEAARLERGAKYGSRFAQIDWRYHLPDTRIDVVAVNGNQVPME